MAQGDTPLIIVNQLLDGVSVQLNFLTDLCKEKRCPIPIPEFVQSILLPW